MIADLAIFYQGAVSLDNLMSMTVSETPLTGILWWLERANEQVRKRNAALGGRRR